MLIYTQTAKQLMNVDVHALKASTFTAIPDNKAFWVCRGDKVTNLHDLANCIESLSPEQFKHHVNPVGKKNDFAVWIFDVLKNPLLAKDLNYEINLKDQKHYAKTIRDHATWLEHA